LDLAASFMKHHSMLRNSLLFNVPYVGFRP
jgi:hypothetical protein